MSKNYGDHYKRREGFNVEYSSPQISSPVGRKGKGQAQHRKSWSFGFVAKLAFLSVFVMILQEKMVFSLLYYFGWVGSRYLLSFLSLFFVALLAARYGRKSVLKNQEAFQHTANTSKEDAVRKRLISVLKSR